MKIHEYQAKQIFARHGVPIPKGYPALSVDEAEAAARRLVEETNSQVLVVKAQIHAGEKAEVSSSRKTEWMMRESSPNKFSVCNLSRIKRDRKGKRFDAFTSSKGSISNANYTLAWLWIERSVELR